MNKKELIKKIVEKKEFSQLQQEDVELAFEKFNKEVYCDEEKIKKTRDLLRKVFSGFTSQKLLLPKDKDESWFLHKHLSTRERKSNYEEIYKKILKNLPKKLTIVDLGAGINGFSYNYFKKLDYEVNYIAVESMGQLSELMNSYFKKENIFGKAYSLSLFKLDKIKELIKKQKKPIIVFLFKVIDSLEMLKKNYSKKLILEISDLSERMIVSFSIQSMNKRKKFFVRRNWILDFIKDTFNVLEDFEINGERYIVFDKKKRNLFNSFP
jgi:hypothetical protein